jgi:hypothetical protein
MKTQGWVQQASATPSIEVPRLPERLLGSLWPPARVKPVTRVKSDSHMLAR